MKKIWTAHLGVGLILLALAGCASTPPNNYENAVDLRDAFVNAGGECISWDQTNSVEISAQSGTCGTDTVLSIYLSPEAVERRVEATKASIFGSLDDDWLIGENWIINAPNVTDLQSELGGRVVSFGS